MDPEAEGSDAGDGFAPEAGNGAPPWLAEIESGARAAGEAGFYAEDRDFGLIFVPRSAETLIVSFDNLSSVKDRSLTRGPWGDTFWRRNGWSCLGILSFAPNWYRDRVLFTRLEALAARGFFRKFARVVFTGTSMGGFGALTFAGLAPGATVVALSPQSTLSRALVPWERRFPRGRAQDWSGPYADAAEGAATAGVVWLIRDSFSADDERHALRLQSGNIRHLRAFFAGHKTALFLRRADILKPVMAGAIAGTLSEAEFYRLMRARKTRPWYVNELFGQAVARDRADLARRIIGSARSSGRTRLAADLALRFEEVFG
jgi:hypothetical protein